jgi:hypothetical protein
MAHIDFGGTVEEVITSEEFTLQRAREVLEKKRSPCSATASRDRARR